MVVTKKIRHGCCFERDKTWMLLVKRQDMNWIIFRNRQDKTRCYMSVSSEQTKQDKTCVPFWYSEDRTWILLRNRQDGRDRDA